MGYKKTTAKKLSTGVYIEYNKEGNIKKCISMYDNELTALKGCKNDVSSIKLHSSFTPLVQNGISKFFNKLDKT